MTIEELKQQIEQRAGVPASLLTGETAEEVVARAKAVLAYKKAQRPKSAKEQFADWMGAQVEDRERRTAELLGQHYETPPADPAGAALAEVAEAYRAEARDYPMTKDSGEVDTSNMPDPRPAREQFAEWFVQKTAFDPSEDADGWKTLA